MEKKSKISFGPDPRILAEYELAKSLLHEKKAIQRRLREVDKGLRDLRVVAVNALECAAHDMVYESNMPRLTSLEKMPAIFK